MVKLSIIIKVCIAQRGRSSNYLYLWAPLSVLSSRDHVPDLAAAARFEIHLVKTKS